MGSNSLYFLMCGNDMMDQPSRDRRMDEPAERQDPGAVVGIFDHDEDFDQTILSNHGRKKSYLQMIYCGLAGSDEGETYEEAMRRAYAIRIKQENIQRASSFSVQTEADAVVDPESLAWWSAMPTNDEETTNVDTQHQKNIIIPPQQIETDQEDTAPAVPTRDTDFSISPLTTEDKENIAAAKELLGFGFEENNQPTHASPPTKNKTNAATPNHRSLTSPINIDNKKTVHIIQITDASSDDDDDDRRRRQTPRAATSVTSNIHETPQPTATSPVDRSGSAAPAEV